MQDAHLNISLEQFKIHISIWVEQTSFKIKFDLLNIKLAYAKHVVLFISVIYSNSHVFLIQNLFVHNTIEI